MFKNLIRAPQREAFEALKKKVDAYAYQPPPIPTLSWTDLVFVLQNHERRIHDLLERRERNRQWLPNANREKRIDFLERRIEQELASARVQVRRAVLHNLRRTICCVRIQRTFLKLLYQPRPGNVPKISRSLLDETFMALDNGDADDDG